jgi:hypothetical protein
MRVDNSFRYRAVISSQLSSILMQLLFSFDHGGTRVEKTLVQTLASQLSSTLVLVWPGHESRENSHANSRFSTLMQLLFSYSHANSRFSTLINSCSRLTTGAWELRKLSCKLSLLNSHATLVLVLSCKFSLLNSHQLSCNSCSRLTGTWELRKLSCKFSLLNSHQLSCNSCFRLTGARELRKLSCKLSLLNSHQLSCNSCFRLTGARELRKLSCKLSLLNSHQLSCNSCSRLTGGENSHANSRFSTLTSISCMQLLFSFDWGMRVETKTLIQTLAWMEKVSRRFGNWRLGFTLNVHCRNIGIL